MISLIAAIDEAGGLGINNQLLCHLPADLRHFKSITMGKPIIMGRKTFESIGNPLSGRLNIVLSRTLAPAKDILIFASLEKAIEQTRGYPEIIIIGGAELFSKGMGLASRLYITQIHHQFDADVFFPRIDESLWHRQSEEYRAYDEKNKYNLTFYIYEKI